MKKQKNMFGEKVGPAVVGDNKYSLDNMELDNKDRVHEGSYDPFYKVNVSPA